MYVLGIHGYTELNEVCNMAFIWKLLGIDKPSQKPMMQLYQSILLICSWFPLFPSTVLVLLQYGNFRTKVFWAGPASFPKKHYQNRHLCREKDEIKIASAVG